MSKSIRSIGAGLRAAARSLATPDTKFGTDASPIVCPMCGHDEFDQRSMLMNTSGMTFFGMDWLNKSACALVCRQCSRIELFAEAPPSR